MSVVKRSGKTSVYERVDVQHKGTGEVIGLERSVGGALVDGGGGGYDCASAER